MYNKASYRFASKDFGNRLGKDTKVYLGSAEVAAVTALFGRLPSKEEYLEIVNKKITDANKESVYKYLNFDQVSAEELETMVK
ncbi:MAG: hypothetical protein JW682_04500 [Campylobacterales bacterium]|nr:hypothetical protein [Campylobacterales bacterium]HEO97686.1 hypothetical protein [Campylobacterota bacterium]